MKEHVITMNYGSQIDVREIPVRDKHPTIFGAIEVLEQGETLELINDHDPKPLQYQLKAEFPEKFEWKYLAQGPDVWRVAITKK
ncbi:MAG: hypothetical protein K0S71_2661 [Clostridia bacterium]|jgi:uncharacterized protein (DUF2249 family)|nr:hypothetical protein [Clostridia bacterium]